jgi:hypothetical protein
MDYKVRNWTRGGEAHFEDLGDALAAVQPPLIIDGDEWEVLFFKTKAAFGAIIARGRGPIPETRVEELTIEDGDLAVSAEPSAVSHTEAG